MEVQVLLQAMKEDPPLDAKCRDKFLVQSIAISADHEASNIQQVVRIGQRELLRVNMDADRDIVAAHRTDSQVFYSREEDSRCILAR